MKNKKTTSFIFIGTVYNIMYLAYILRNAYSQHNFSWRIAARRHFEDQVSHKLIYFG